MQFCTRFRNFWPKFGPLKLFSSTLYLLDVRHCCKLSSYAISRKTNEPSLKRQQKTQFWVQFRPIQPKFGLPFFFFFFFFKILAQSVTRYNGQLSSCTISEKTNNPILRKLVKDGWTDGQTDRQKDRRARVISLDVVRLTLSV